MVRGTLSPLGRWRPTVVARFPPTLARTLSTPMQARRLVLLASSLLAFSVASAQSRNALETGRWFAGFESGSGEYVRAFAADSVSEEDRLAGIEYGRLIERLVQAECPSVYSFSGSDPGGGGAFTYGEEVFIRTFENCIRKRMDTLTPVVADSLETLYQVFTTPRSDQQVGFSWLADPLLQVHRAWLAGREAVCEYEASRFSGGTGATYGYLTCAIQELENHFAWVKQELWSVRNTGDIE